jgi:hypothetical protein
LFFFGSIGDCDACETGKQSGRGSRGGFQKRMAIEVII